VRFFTTDVQKKIIPVQDRCIQRFYAEVLVENRPMLFLFDRMGFYIKKRREEGVYELEMMFR
jgi:ribosomal protein S18 acetylase RimI-like enzyme